MQLFQTPKIDFVARRRLAYIISSSIFIIGFVSIILRGGPNLGIDFKGGTSILLKYQSSDTITIESLREALGGAGFINAEIKRTSMDLSAQESGGQEGPVESERKDEYVQIYVDTGSIKGGGSVGDAVESALKDLFGTLSHEILKTDIVGPKIGAELRNAVILAVLISLLLILIYIGWRFELVFSFGAIIALFHDVLITLGIYTLLNFELSLKEIAAFLTIVGYSLNDTIVVYDRIRENLKVMRNEDLPHIINASINQCLSRTVITSLTTFTVVLILFLFGGEIIKGFAFTMLIGVVVGTYSSIFVASPVILEWQMRHGGKRELKMSKKKRR
jgi:preprotein translocase SecF subunit